MSERRMEIGGLDEFMSEAAKNGLKESVSFFPSDIAIGRNVVWCPYLNEPAFLTIGNKGLDCPNCNGNYEPTSHTFICRILKP